jgi:hypothetical protein
LNVTNEVYYYCGSQSYIGNGKSCSIDPYQNTLAQITGAGAVPVATTVTNVTETSYSLFESSSGFAAASQYGGIFYQHDLSSVIVYNFNSSSIYEIYFGDISLGDIDL